jgi:hypothetical protein
MASVRVGLFLPDDQPLTGGPDPLRAMLARVAEAALCVRWCRLSASSYCSFRRAYGPSAGKEFRRCGEG